MECTIDSWLDPDGNIIEVGRFAHNSYANELLIGELGGINEVFDYMEEHKLSYPYEVLHKRGWVRIKIRFDYSYQFLGNTIDLTKPMRNTINPAMNEAQLRVAMELCNNDKEVFHRAINDKRFW